MEGPSYTELFNQRGTSYDQAMMLCPDARAQEFYQAIDLAGIHPGMLVADVPAGGGYLQRYLPAGCTWLGHEPCPTFTNHRTDSGQSAGRPLLPLPWNDGAVDVALSIAGVHHLADKRELFAEMLRITRPGGRFVLSDVAAGTTIAAFLDGFVGDNNSTGHAGVFLDDHTIWELEQAGWSVVSHGLNHFHWVFPDRPAMAAFCRKLFDICKANSSQIEQALVAGPGVEALQDGMIGLKWTLMTIVAERPGG